jgi:hypothetical protein
MGDRRPALGARVQPSDQVGPHGPIGTVVRRPPGVTYVTVAWDESALWEQDVRFADRNLVVVRPCEFSAGDGFCGRPAAVIRRLAHETPYGLCAEHADEDADILELSRWVRKATDVPASEWVRTW